MSSLWIKARKRLGGVAIQTLFEGLARLGKLHPQANPAKQGVEVIKDIPYRDTGSTDHTLDVYRPIDRKHPGPCILYIHGGAFRILSKETHWIMGLIFARFGYTVFNINYRLAPQHRYPAAIEDATHACRWVLENAAAYGADPSRLSYAGESAGGNLVTSLAICGSYRQPEPWAAAVYDANPSPRAVIVSCAILQVSNIERMRRRKRLSKFVYDRLAETSYAYLGSAKTGSRSLDLADPLVLLERGEHPDRPLPPMMAWCGTKDPLLDDTRRLGVALDALGSPNEVRIYPGGVHAFHAMAFSAQARECWRHQLEFLGKYARYESCQAAATS
jgi:acetyl esterase